MRILSCCFRCLLRIRSTIRFMLKAGNRQVLPFRGAWRSLAARSPRRQVAGSNPARKNKKEIGAWRSLAARLVWDQ